MLLKSRLSIRGVLLAAIITILLSGPLLAASPQVLMAKEKQKTAKAASDNTDISLPENLSSSDVDSVIASLSDQQVRRLLIDELKKQAELEARAAAGPEMGGLAGFINTLQQKFTIIKERIEYLKSGAASSETNIPDIFSYLGEGERATSKTRAIVSIIIVFAGAFLIEWLFGRYTAGIRRKIRETEPANWRAKIGTLVLRLAVDLLHVLIFALAVLAIFYLFTDRNMAQRVLVSTYLAAVLIVRAVYLITRFILAPRVGQLRFLPLTDATASYLQGWIVAIVAVTSFGLLTCGIIRLTGASEGYHFIMVNIVSLVIVIMLIAMILIKRKAAFDHLAVDLPPESLRFRLAKNWYVFAIFTVVLLWASSIVNDLLDTGNLQGMRTLTIIALYFLADWILRQILAAAFGLAEQPPELKLAFNTAGTGEPADDDEDDQPERPKASAPDRTDDEVETQKEETVEQKPLNIKRMRSVIQTGLRIVLAVLMFLWIMSVWGIQLPIGRAVAGAAFDILIVVVICYVIWEVSSAYIQRRLQAEMPETDEDMEEGGAGGSRIGTLLLLLRKFLLVVLIVMASLIVLSTIGVDIGPLIAGAGVIGLAIGFGAQTLVKDIISGIFYLVDDAFRVGDYVQAGGTKGMVEHISIRSLRLREPRGMVNTIPYSAMGIVTNFSRDYIITKLDFRVRYDADVEKIRKIIKKKVYKPILKNKELASKLLGKIKSQGVREMDDSAMIMRVKYKTIPGEQFVIRKEVYRLMQEAFREAGIEFAHRNVTVYIPPETTQAVDGEAKRKIMEAGAAAGLAAQAEEEAKAQKSAKGK